jgi:starch phosphorylase
VILLENYDIDMARYLVSGTDVWLNNPIRPYEASGTSGQKAALNGQPNCSVLDGWWAEAYNGHNGWAIGEAREYHDQEVQADADSLSLYHLLEDQILPAFFERGEDGVPHRWVGYMKETIRTCAPQFSMRRMLKEYTTRYYVPDIRRSLQIEQNHFEQVRTLAAWKDRILQHWNRLELYVDGRREGQLSLGEGIDVHAWVRADGLAPEDLCVELVYGETHNELVAAQQSHPMTYSKREQDGSYRYDAQLQPGDSGNFAYNVRVVPCHGGLTEKYEQGLIRWG